MPPRKRARVSEAASPTSTPNPKTPTAAGPAQSPSKVEDAALKDPWTDDEEVGLYKGIIKWKPTGIHKHFRMLQLRRYLVENGYIHPRAPHTLTPGIWSKLASLYDLEALDQREDARQLSDLSEGDMESNAEKEDDDEEDDVYSLAENKIHNEEFSLPQNEYGEAMWKRRIAGDKEKRDESPGVLDEVNLADDMPVRFTPSFSVEPSETTATPSGRSARGRPPKGTAARGRGGAAASVGPRRSARQAESVAEESEEDEEDDSDGDEDDEESEDEEESQASTPAPRSSRGARGRPRGSTNRARGRGRKR